MIYVVVGCDATGKTTLCEKLARKEDCRVWHMMQPKTIELDNMYMNYAKAIYHADNVIFDRCFYCEEVYGPIFRGKSAISVSEQHKLERALKHKGAKIYYCYDDAISIFKRFKITKEHFVVTLEQVQAILDGYEKVLADVQGIEIVRYKIGDKLDIERKED